MVSTITKKFNIKNKFLRSTNLERDFSDINALENYVLTKHALECLERISVGREKLSSQRAWRITGDYGAGKSSFALFLAHWISNDNTIFSEKVKKSLNSKGLSNNDSYQPILVTGTREPMGKAIIRSLYLKVKETSINAGLEKKLKALDNKEYIEDSVVVNSLNSYNAILAKQNKNGLILIIDELGKFLEFAAMAPGEQDIYLMQSLAEAAAGSKETPFFVIGILHQGFSAYASSLSQESMREWEKVAGRYDELIFSQPLEQIASLTNSALGVDTASLDKKALDKYKQWLSEFLDYGWFGHSAGKESLLSISSSIYPLHPCVLPVVVDFFHRFGQNERSLFSFLLSNEPFGVQDIAATRSQLKPYNLCDFYDYVRTNFGNKLYSQSFRNNWHIIDSLIESFTGNSETDLKVLKTIGIINLLNNNRFIADKRVIESAIEDIDTNNAVCAKESIKKLLSKRVIYNRGISGGYCLWAHTSINLDVAYQKAQNEIGDKVNVVEYIRNNSQPRPIVARRHYICTGNLRAFSCSFCLPNELDKIEELSNNDMEGHILIPLCETEEEYIKVQRSARKSSQKKRKDILWAIPKPLQYLEKLIKDLKCWEFIERNTLELNSDFYAYEEVSRQLLDAKERLDHRLKSFIDLKNLTEESGLKLYHCSKPQNIETGRQLLSFLSDCFDNIYEQAPIIKNELVNRKLISSAAAAARMRLIPRILSNSNEKDLGLEKDKTPPEKAIYLSLIQNAGFHQDTKGDWAIMLPKQSMDKCNLLPSMKCIDQILTEKLDSKISLDVIYNALMAPPYGVREGVIPILLALYVSINETDLAVYEEGTFLRKIRQQEFLRLTKAPQKFEFQFCSIGGVRNGLFNQMIEMLNVSNAKKEPHLLDVVKPLCVFVAELPDYVKKTKRLANATIQVRSAIMSAQSPLDLIFLDLPKACGFSSLTDDTPPEVVEEFIAILRSSIYELQMSYNNLKDRLKDLIAREMNEENQFTIMRRNIAQRAENVLLAVTEPSLKAFVFRLFDDNLGEAQWIESMGAFVTSKTPDRWLDNDEEKFISELPRVIARFKNAESISFSKGENSSQNQIGCRVALTKSSGEELQQVLFHTEKESSQVKKLQDKISKLLDENKRLGVIAASQEIWKILENKES